MPENGNEGGGGIHSPKLEHTAVNVSGPFSQFYCASNARILCYSNKEDFLPYCDEIYMRPSS